ncbi:hypothetical protein ACQ4PT_051109 [Festuca glaucescens]
MGLAAFASGRFTALVVNGFMLTAASDKEGAASDLFEEEVDRRAEEFISAFQHRIRVDSSLASRSRQDPVPPSTKSHATVRPLDGMPAAGQ